MESSASYDPILDGEQLQADIDAMFERLDARYFELMGRISMSNS